ncbi:hypothetical protein FI667_g6480, partial [Globisporangium splendens]
MSASPAEAIQAQYQRHLRIVGADLPAEELLSRYPPRPSASSTPSEAANELNACMFYSDFAASPSEINAQREQVRQNAKDVHGEKYVQNLLDSPQHHELKKERQFDFRLKDPEMQRLAQNGFVVSQRMSAESFAEVYYQLYTDDMPVYITTDSILHAWHRSFDAALVDIEQVECMPKLQQMVSAMQAKCHEMFHGIGVSDETSTNAKRILLDVDLFLTIGVSLLTGGEESSGLVANSSRVSSLLNHIESQEMQCVVLFGAEREVDFSLFKPRGHYTKTEELMKYFRAMTWLGTIDFRVAGGEDTQVDLYQLQCAVVLVHLLRVSDQMQPLSVLDVLITSLVGDSDVGADSLTPMQLDTLLTSGASVFERFVGSESSSSILLELQQKVIASGWGTQLISGHPHIETSSAADTSPTVLPTSFSLFGQRFVWSSFIFSRLVYDQVIHKQTKVVRRLPSAVDVAFSLLGNDAAGSVAAQRMDSTAESTAFMPLRDGVPYASNLLALRATIDDVFAADTSKDDGISTLWIRALRALSARTASAATAFHSHEWQLRQMNTQLASFTQLRHDSVLYAKQSYTMGTRCEYAAGFVDPYPQFFANMQQLATRMAQIVQNLATPSEDSDIKYNGFHFFSDFAATLQTLKEIADCQVQKQPLNEEQTDFVKTVMEERFGSGGSRYLGWYPRLFYTNREDSGKRDVLVVDVHTDVPSVEHSDPGGILHLGVGDVHFGFFVVDSVMYSGPVFSSYEFVTDINERLNDDEFQAKVASLGAPDWARNSYLS